MPYRPASLTDSRASHRETPPCAPAPNKKGGDTVIRPGADRKDACSTCGVELPPAQSLSMRTVVSFPWRWVRAVRSSARSVTHDGVPLLAICGCGMSSLVRPLILHFGLHPSPRHFWPNDVIRCLSCAGVANISSDSFTIHCAHDGDWPGAVERLFRHVFSSMASLRFRLRVRPQNIQRRIPSPYPD